MTREAEGQEQTTAEDRGPHHACGPGAPHVARRWSRGRGNPEDHRDEEQQCPTPEPAIPPVGAGQDSRQGMPQHLREGQVCRHGRVVEELGDRRDARHPQGDPGMPHRPRHHVRAHVLHGIARGAPRQQGAGHQQDKAQAADDRKRTEQHEPAQDWRTDGLEQGRGRRWHGAPGQRRAHREHERAAHPMPIDHRDVLPGDCIEAVRHRRQGDRQGRGILLVHSGVIVVQSAGPGHRAPGWR